MRITASAPGKFVLSGEYAVLDGAPAVCVAVDRRARVSIEPYDSDHCVVHAPGFSTETGQFIVDPDGLNWLAGGEDYELFEAVWAASRPALANGAVAIFLDTTAFRDPASGSKIGLGSSAALAAALASALHAFGGGRASEAAHAGHRRFQGGAGSGVDVACSLAGGVIEYLMADRQTKTLTWPAGLHCSVLWSGVAAGTRDRLARFDVQPDSDARANLVQASNVVASAFESGDAAAVLASLVDYTRTLRRFDDSHELGIFTAGHGQLADSATDEDIVYKPCGAGGGDIGIALATSRASLASFEDTAARAGFSKLALSVDPRGAELHGKDEL